MAGSRVLQRHEQCYITRCGPLPAAPAHYFWGRSKAESPIDALTWQACDGTPFAPLRFENKNHHKGLRRAFLMQISKAGRNNQQDSVIKKQGSSY